MASTDALGGSERAAAGERGHLLVGAVGLVAVLAVFLVEYGPIAAAVERTLGVLGSTAIVWLFFAVWLVLWLGLDAALLRLGGPDSR